MDGREEAVACDLDLLAGAGAVDEVMQHDDLLVAGQATGGHAAGAFLEGQLLVVAVDGLGHIHLQAAQRLGNVACHALNKMCD